MTKGAISEIKGGGLYGEGMRLLQNYPGTQELTYPLLKKPGYWWLYEAGTGTNPKYFKHPARCAKATISPNAMSPASSTGPSAPKSRWGRTRSNEWAPETDDFARKNQLPRGHSMHQHNLLPTFQVRIRDLDQWVTLIEHGGLTALNDVYVRALASRYGNPERDPAPRLRSGAARHQRARQLRRLCAQSGRLLEPWAQSIEDDTYQFFKP